MTDSANNQSTVLSDKREWNSGGKHIEITLMWGEFRKAYQVLSIKDTTWYQPGMWLSTEIVSTLCGRKDWSVTMIHDDIVKNVVNFIGGKLPGISLPA